GLGGREVEGGREDANDGIRLAIEDDGLAEHIAAATEAALPGGIAEQDGTGRVGLVLTGAEIAAEDGRDAEGPEEASADARAIRILHAVRGLQEEAVGGEDVDGREHGVLALPVEIVKVGEVKAGTEGVAFEQDGKAGRVGVGQ